MAFDAFTQSRATFRPDGFTVGPRHAFMLDMDMRQNLRPALFGVTRILNDGDGNMLHRLRAAHDFVSNWADRMPYSAILRLRAMNLAMQVFERSPPQKATKHNPAFLSECVMVRHQLALESITPEQVSFERRMFRNSPGFRDEVIESLAKYMHQFMDDGRLTLTERTMEIAVGLGMTSAESAPLRSRLRNFGDSQACHEAALFTNPQIDVIAEERFHRRAQRAARNPRAGLARTLSRI